MRRTQRRTRGFLQRFTRPSPDIGEPDAQLQAQLLAALMGVLLLLSFIGLGVSYLVVPDYYAPFPIIGGFLGVSFAYLLSRTRYWLQATLLGIATIQITIISTALLEPQFVLLLFYLILGVLLSAILLPVRVTVIIGLLSTAGAVLTLMAVPISQAGSQLTVSVVAFLVMTTALILMFTRHRNRVEAERQRELAELYKTVQRHARELKVRVAERTAELRDEIGERVQAERQLRRAYQDLKAADQLKEEMIQNIAHEFRTPLTYLMAYAGLLLEEDPDIGSLTDEQRENLKTIMTQTHRLAALVDTVTAVDRATTFVPDVQPLDVDLLLQAVVADATLPASERDIDLSSHLPDDLPFALADEGSIRRVLDNLVSNAIKFTPRGGRVRLQARAVTDEGKVYVSVSDTGIGIPQEVRDRVFERFYQVDGSTKRKYEGMGLGLALCKEIIVAHGERLWVEETSGQGTTMTFTLPVVQEQLQR